jgi:hypothetical protein
MHPLLSNVDGDALGLSWEQFSIVLKDAVLTVKEARTYTQKDDARLALNALATEYANGSYKRRQKVQAVYEQVTREVYGE